MIPWPEALHDETRSQAADSWLADLVLEEVIGAVSRCVDPPPPLGDVSEGHFQRVFEELLALFARPAVAYRLEQLVRLAACVGITPFTTARSRGKVQGIGNVMSRTNQGSRSWNDLRPHFFDFGAAASLESMRRLPTGCFLELDSDLIPLRFEVDEGMTVRISPADVHSSSGARLKAKELP